MVRSESTTDENSKQNEPDSNGQVSASSNIPGGAGPNASTSTTASGSQESTTNYEISHTTRTEVQEPGQVKRLSVAVAVDGITAEGKDGKPGAYTPRSAQEMQQIEQLVRSAVGYNADRGDQVTVVNVRFPSAADPEGVTAANPLLGFDKNDIMRAAELGVLAVVAVLMIFFVVKPLLAPGGGKGGKSAAGDSLPLLPGQPVTRISAAADGQPLQLTVDPVTGQLALPGPVGGIGAGGGELDHKIDIARIEGQVKASSVKRVAEFVERHPEESVAILRNWLHES